MQNSKLSKAERDTMRLIGTTGIGKATLLMMSKNPALTRENLVSLEASRFIAIGEGQRLTLTAKGIRQITVKLP